MTGSGDESAALLSLIESGSTIPAGAYYGTGMSSADVTVAGVP